MYDWNYDKNLETDFFFTVKNYDWNKKILLFRYKWIRIFLRRKKWLDFSLANVHVLLKRIFFHLRSNILKIGIIEGFINFSESSYFSWEWDVFGISLDWFCGVGNSYPCVLDLEIIQMHSLHPLKPSLNSQTSK